MMRACVVCGKEFVPYRKSHKTCSPECSAENHRARTRMLCKQYKAEERANRVYQPIKCKFCGKEFTPTHGHQRYCSAECSHASFRECTRRWMASKRAARRAERARDMRQPIRCRWCGKMFAPEHGHQRYCSAECKNEAKCPKGVGEYLDLSRRLRPSTVPAKPGAERPESSAACMLGLSRSTMTYIGSAIDEMLNLN